MSLLWSIVPTDSIFATETKDISLLRSVPAAEATMILSDVGGGMGKIERLLSTNPNDYLRPEWQPGCLVRLADFNSDSV